MNTPFISRFGILLLILLTSYPSFAQLDSAKSLPTVTVSGSRINEKVWSSFRKSFKDAVDPKWHRIDQDFLVKFIMNDQDQSALFNKKGTLVYHITYGSEKYLPDDIRKQIRSVYYDYKIIKAFSIRESNRLVWVVNLEDDKNMLVLRVEDGEMEEAKNYKKSAQ